MSPIRQTAYLEAWDDLPTDALEFGVNAAIRECRTFPRPVEIREFASAFRRPQTRGAYNTSQLAATTEYNRELADEAMTKIMGMFGDEWQLPTTRRSGA